MKMHNRLLCICVHRAMLGRLTYHNSERSKVPTVPLGSYCTCMASHFPPKIILSAIRVPQASCFSFSILDQIANLLLSVQGPAWFILLQWTCWFYPIEKMCASLKSRTLLSPLWPPFITTWTRVDNWPTLWTCQTDNLTKNWTYCAGVLLHPIFILASPVVPLSTPST